MINEKYSYKDFTNRTFNNVCVDEFNGKGDIVGSSFYQEMDTSEQEVSRNIFPSEMVGVEFKRCNLDNVFMPGGNTVAKNCSHRLIRCQNDLNDWVVDENNVPIEPVNKKYRLSQGLNVDPKDIPKQ